MSTLSLRAHRAHHVPHVWSNVVRVAAAIAKALDFFAETRLRELAAHNRLPFADW